MPGADFYRALATAHFVRNELMHERDAHNAMKLCFEKIHKSLDMYQGHYINRLRFHLNRHHTEYLRKVRAMRKERNEQQKEEESTKLYPSSTSSRRSMRVAVAQELSNEVEDLKRQLRSKDLEICRLTMLLDEKNVEPIVVATVEKKPARTPRPAKAMNPYLPSSSDDGDDAPGSSCPA